MTRRSATTGTRGRSPRDPYGIGPAAGYIAPVVAMVALVIIAIVTLGLMNGQLPFRSTGSTPGGPGGPIVTPAPSNFVIVPPDLTFTGSIAYAKAGNIWVQTGKSVHQITDGGQDSMPAFAADGSWVYFIRIQESRGKFPAGGNLGRAWYDLSTPSLMRTKPDGSGTPQKLLTGQYRNGTSTWFYWLRQPTPSPDGKSVAVISDGPNPLQSDIVLQSYDVAAKTLTSLNLPESLHLGHQDPAWRPDGRLLLYVRNGRELTRGAPEIFRYDPKTKATKAVTGPGYLSPSWSPDGKYIAATKTDAFGSDVVILDVTGKELLKVSDDDHSFSPAWSPAGDAIAFLHLQGTIVDLRMSEVDTSTGRWAVSRTIDLTKVSGLDGASRPSWFVQASERPASTAPPSAGPGVASPSAGSAAP